MSKKEGILPLIIHTQRVNILRQRIKQYKSPLGKQNTQSGRPKSLPLLRNPQQYLIDRMKMMGIYKPRNKGILKSWIKLPTSWSDSRPLLPQLKIYKNRQSTKQQNGITVKKLQNCQSEICSLRINRLTTPVEQFRKLHSKYKQSQAKLVQKRLQELLSISKKQQEMQLFLTEA